MPEPIPMNADDGPSRLQSAAAPGAGGFLRKAAAIAAGAVALGAALVFSVVFFAAAVVVGAVAWGYLAWRTRGVRRDLRERMAAAGIDPERGPVRAPSGDGPPRGRVIEGEAVSVPDDPR